MNGWIKISYKLLEWEWFQSPDMVQIFLYFLLKANYEKKRWLGIVIERGQFVTSLSAISKETHLSTQVVRTCINRLISTSEITCKSTNKYRIITICKYDDYQQNENSTNNQNNMQFNNQLTSKQQTNNNQLTTTKEYKTNNKETIPKGIVKKDKLSLSEQVDYKGLMDYFNKMFAGKLPAVSVMTEKRKRAVKARVTELGKDSIASVLKKVFESNFLLGLNDRNWRADFDWIFAPSHFIQILEGKYENGDSKNKRDSQQWKSDAIATISTTVNEQAKEKRAELKAKGVID